MSGARHVVNASIDQDNLTGASKGTANISVRLGAGESAATIINNIRSSGAFANVLSNDNRKKSNFT